MSKNIHFFSEDISYSLSDKTKIRKWISGAAEAENSFTGDICIVFCSDAYLLKLNRKYLKHNTLTDILTFPLIEDNSQISGDIFISISRVRENARKFRQKIDKEVLRVIIHGVLHLLGYTDSSAEDKARMKIKEDYYLSIFDQF
jgi:probable rRNA maturation factor